MNYCLKKKIVIAEEDKFFKQRMTSSSANSIFFKQKMFDKLECDGQAVCGGERAGWTRVAGRNIDLLVEY